MSSTTTTFGHDDGLVPLLRPFAVVATVTEALTRAQAAAADFERLSAMSAEALANRGLTRDGIARAVMERHYR